MTRFTVLLWNKNAIPMGIIIPSHWLSDILNSRRTRTWRGTRRYFCRASLKRTAHASQTHVSFRFACSSRCWCVSARCAWQKSQNSAGAGEGELISLCRRYIRHFRQYLFHVLRIDACHAFRRAIGCNVDIGGTLEFAFRLDNRGRITASPPWLLIW